MIRKGLPSNWLNKFPTFSHKDFHITKEKKLFENEASALGLKPGEFLENLNITGLKYAVAFRRDYAYGGDEFWMYVPFQDYVDSNPELKGWRVIIWND